MYRLLTLLCSLLLLFACTSSSVKFDPSKAHHGDGKFDSIKEGSFFDWLTMRWHEDSPPEPDLEKIKAIVGSADRALIESSADTPRATWIGHSTVLVQYQGINFLTDPHLSQHPFYFEFAVKPRYTQPALTFEQMPKIDFIVISHNHYDHLDHRTVDMFSNSVKWFVPLGLKAWFLDRDIKPENVVELDWWDEYQFNDQVKITFTPNQHWSKRTPWDTNESLWGSWVVDIAGFKSWFAGDTGYDQAMFREIAEKLGPFRFAMIPIGAYAPRYFMSITHVDPAEAVEIHKDIKAQKTLGIHWGAFHLTHEPFLEPPVLLEQALKAKNILQTAFETIKIGDTLVLD
jgi:N-acyl-phosphatidylethanolamine-hydrolysing phospholipase D